MKKNSRLIWLIAVFVLIVLGLSLLQYHFSEKMKPEIWAGVLGSYVAIYFGLVRHWIDHDTMFKELFLELNARFDDMNEDLNSIVKNEKPVSDKTTEQVIQDYLNLCAEEYLWYKKGRIDEEVWKAWRAGMLEYIKTETIKVIFERESDFDMSYYGLFGELKISKKN